MADPDKAPQRLDIGKLRGNLADILGQARDGHAFLITWQDITWQDEVVAELRPPPKPARAPRRPGALRGMIRMAPDFDTLPPEVLAAMEGEGG